MREYSKAEIFDGINYREMKKRQEARKNGHGGARVGAGRPKGSKASGNRLTPNYRNRITRNIVYIGEDIWDTTITHGSLEIMRYLGVTAHHLRDYMEHDLPHYLPELRQGDHNANYDPAGISQRGFVKREVDEWCLAHPDILVCPPLEWKVTIAHRDDYEILEGKALLIYPEWAL
tara:strand:+ start:42 stop:566 length:525 start_codon:yes stop_codon:yes gene_type:complete